MHQMTSDGSKKCTERDSVSPSAIFGVCPSEAAWGLLLRAESGACAGAVFFSLVFLALTSLTTVDLLVNERGLVVKESLGGYYRPVSYYLSKGEGSEALLRDFTESCSSVEVM